MPRRKTSTDGLVTTGNHVDKDTMKMVKRETVKRNALKKYASGISVTPPTYYNPLYTPTSLQLPRDRKQINVWCFTPDTPILMHDGTTKRIEDVQLNDKVINQLCDAYPVTYLHKRWVNEKIYNIKSIGVQNSLRLTGNHNVYVSKFSDGILEKIEARDIKPGYFLATPINKTVIESDLTEEDAYVLGLYAAEGSTLWRPAQSKKIIGLRLQMTATEQSCDLEKINKVLKPHGVVAKAYKDKSKRLQPTHIIDKDFAKNYLDGTLPVDVNNLLAKYRVIVLNQPNQVRKIGGIRFSIHKKEKETLGRKIFTWALKFNANAKYYADKRTHNERECFSLDIQISNQKCYEFVSQFITGNSKTKKLSKLLTHAPLHIQQKFIDGYLAGDGHDNKSNGAQTLNCVSKNLIEQTSFILNRLGHINGFGEYHQNLNSKNPNGIFYQLRVTSAVQASKYLIKNKIAVLDNPDAGNRFIKNGFVFRKITSVSTEDYEGYVHNLEVGGGDANRKFDENMHSYTALYALVANCRHFYN
jgi:intein/homing endonuclease